MINISRFPAQGTVAIDAILGSLNMAHLFSGCKFAIMTTATRPKHLVVIHFNVGFESGGAVTSTADIRCQCVIR